MMIFVERHTSGAVGHEGVIITVRNEADIKRASLRAKGTATNYMQDKSTRYVDVTVYPDLCGKLKPEDSFVRWCLANGLLVNQP